MRLKNIQTITSVIMLLLILTIFLALVISMKFPYLEFTNPNWENPPERNQSKSDSHAVLTSVYSISSLKEPSDKFIPLPEGNDNYSQVTIDSNSTYYLDVNHPDARDKTANGTLAKPWKTLYYALLQLKPGDTLLIRGGIYHEQRWLTLDENHTGYETLPITVQSYPGESVVIWNSKPISFYGANWWTIQGLVFESPGANNRNIRLGLHIGLGDARTVPAEHITVRDCEFWLGVKTAIAVSFGNHILIEDNYFHHIRPGRPYIEAKSELSAIGIRYQGDNIVIQRNRFEDIGSDGVHLGALGYRPGSDIREVTIIDNEFWVNRPYKGILGNVGENGIDVKWVRGPVLIKGNHIHGFRPTTPNQDASGAHGVGITIHDNAQNVIIERNFFSDNTQHIKVARGSDGSFGKTTNIIIRKNKFEDAKSDEEHDGVAILIRYVGKVHITSNTIVSNDDKFYLKANGGGDVVFKNNIVIGGRAGGDIEEINWDAYGNFWQGAAIHPLLRD